jgi:hypothetical protein
LEEGGRIMLHDDESREKDARIPSGGGSASACLDTTRVHNSLLGRLASRAAPVILAQIAASCAMSRTQLETKREYMGLV